MQEELYGLTSLTSEEAAAVNGGEGWLYWVGYAAGVAAREVKDFLDGMADAGTAK